jgi:hypothetical protein
MQLTIRQGRRYRAARPNEIMDAAAALLIDEQVGKLTVVSAPRDTVDLLRMLTRAAGTKTSLRSGSTHATA